MLAHEHATVAQERKNELGTVICKVCGEILYTLPTNRVQVIYGVCKDHQCLYKSGGLSR